uniref:Uncharacterized protein n=1 Tax=Oryza punctata TaxID=4537 RepID=A0A0E0JZF4_ORYPU
MDAVDAMTVPPAADASPNSKSESKSGTYDLCQYVAQFPKTIRAKQPPDQRELSPIMIVMSKAITRETVQGKNVLNKVQESLPTPVSVESMHKQKNAQPNQSCFNYLEPGSRLSECPPPKPRETVSRCFNYGKTYHISAHRSKPRHQYHQASNFVCNILAPHIHPKYTRRIGDTNHRHRKSHCLSSNAHLKAIEIAPAGQEMLGNQQPAPTARRRNNPSTAPATSIFSTRSQNYHQL